jgi:formylglycine-generating enzyme required for sulfatase activity
MGSPSDEVGRASNESQVSVALTRSYLLGETEVTQGQWKALSQGINPSANPTCGDTCPIENVTWWSVFGYANARSVAEGYSHCFVLPATGCTGSWQAGTLSCGDAMPSITSANIFDCAGYRLPTEAEWEYAARAGTTTATYGGDLMGSSGCVSLSGVGAFPTGTPLANLAWYDCNSNGTTKATKGKAANTWGLYDILGNVWEWTWDRYGDAHIGGTNPQRTASGIYRVVRGGGWHGEGPTRIRAANRDYGWPTVRYGYVGFRLARSLP